MSELNNSDLESKTGGKPAVEEFVAGESSGVESNQKMYAESASIASSNNASDKRMDVFDKSRRSSAAMAESGELPSLKIEESGERSDPDAPLSEDEIRDMLQGMADAKGKTKGWDSKDPPSVDEIKDRIGDSQIVFWGDDHMDKESPERFKNALDSLKEAGIDTVAMEGFREDQQGLIDDWLKAEKGSEEEKRLEAQMREYLARALGGEPEFAEKTMAIMKAIKDAGMKILAIEPNGAKITSNGDGKDMDRDANWQKVVENHTRNNPDSKVLIFGGSGHFIHMRGITVADRMGRTGTKTADLTPPSQYIEGDIKVTK